MSLGVLVNDAIVDVIEGDVSPVRIQRVRRVCSRNLACHLEGHSRCSSCDADNCRECTRDASDRWVFIRGELHRRGTEILKASRE